MLVIYHSNQLDLLVSILSHLIEQEPLSDVFSKEIILVQNTGIAQWLQLQFAEKFGIAANLDCIFPANFIQNIAQQLLGDTPQQGQFSRERLIWHFLAIFPSFQADKQYPELYHYLNHLGTPNKQYQLARQLAVLFDNYLLYRPEWLAAWEQHHTIATESTPLEQWQAELWRRMVQRIRHIEGQRPHRAQLYQSVIERLSTMDGSEYVLPKRVFVCGISTLPPVYISFLHALSRHCEVHLMVQSPCQIYWGSNKNSRWLGLQLKQHNLLPQRQNPSLEKSLSGTWLPQILQEMENNHPLLAAWGKLGRDYWQLLQEIPDAQQIEAFVENTELTHLAKVQQDILLLEDHSLLLSTHRQYPQHQWNQHDNSITIHSCHSPLREVEVLQDYLLTILDNDPTLELRDIVVMVADIECYSPYITAVFNPVDNERYLPFSIADAKLSSADPILTCFLMLLNLPQSRCYLTDMMELLEVTALAERFNITESIRETLQHWIDGAGIRWALDDAHLTELELPATHQNTWEFGLRRMLLGYAMQSEQGVFNGLLPYDAVGGLSVEWVGYLADFIVAVRRWRQILMQPHPLSEWQVLGSQLLADFFNMEGESHIVLLFLKQQWLDLLQHIEVCAYDQPISIGILHHELLKRFEQPAGHLPFLVGRLNFCHLIPMRAIPFKVICLLGMSEGSYPREGVQLSFDLLKQYPARGDRNQREDDYYLFLESLLSAQQKFYVSYVGAAIVDDTPQLSAIMVRELADYITQSFCISIELTSEQNSREILSQLLRQHPRTPFSVKNFQPPEMSYANEWITAVQRQDPPYIDFANDPLPVKTVVSLELTELQRFYRHPIRWFFQQRLGVYFYPAQGSILAEEPFSLDGLARYRLNDRLLAASLESNQDKMQLWVNNRGSGILPYGALGELIYQDQAQEMTQLAETVQSHWKPGGQMIEIDLHLNNIRLTGWLSDLHREAGLIRWQPNHVTIRDGFALWIEHLTQCALGYQLESCCFGREDTQFAYAPLDTSQARDYLEQLLVAYQASLVSPLYFIPTIAWEWLITMIEKESMQLSCDPERIAQADLKLLKHFQTISQGNRLLTDPYYQRLLHTVTPQQLQQIKQLAQQFLLPLRQHKIKK